MGLLPCAKTLFSLWPLNPSVLGTLRGCNLNVLVVLEPINTESCVVCCLPALGQGFEWGVLFIHVRACVCFISPLSQITHLKSVFQ